MHEKNKKLCDVEQKGAYRTDYMHYHFSPQSQAKTKEKCYQPWQHPTLSFCGNLIKNYFLQNLLNPRLVPYFITFIVQELLLKIIENFPFFQLS